MSINNFEDFIRSAEFNKVIFEEYDFIEISKNDNTRILKRTNYNLNKLKNIDFPFVLLKLVEDLLDKINLELTVNETYTHNNVNYYCNLKSELEHYKFIEDIYYNLNLKCDDNNNITIETSIDKKYNENDINEKKLNRINLHSFVLNIT